MWGGVFRPRSSQSQDITSKSYASNEPLPERRMRGLSLRGVHLGRMPVSSFRVRHFGCYPHLQKVTAHVMCTGKVRGRGALNLPLAEDKLFDIKGVTNVVNPVSELVG